MNTTRHHGVTESVWVSPAPARRELATSLDDTWNTARINRQQATNNNKGH